MPKVLKQTIIYDEDSGEVYSDKTTSGSANGKGFVLMYTERVQKLILECPSATTLKVFMLLSMGQQFEERGMVTTKKAVQEKLGITKPTCLAAFDWLKDRMIINESKINGCTEFMVNPAYVTVGRDRKKRQKEWIRRWSGGTITALPEPEQNAIAPAKPVKKVRPKVRKLVAAGRSIEVD